MIFYVTELDENNRILSGSNMKEFAPEGMSVDVPDDFLDNVSSDYIFDGRYSAYYSPKPPTEEEIAEKEKAEQTEKFIEEGPTQLSDIDDIICGLYESNLYLEDQIQQLKASS